MSDPPGEIRKPLLGLGCRAVPEAVGRAQLVFGEGPDGRMVHISDVESGLACQCRCAACHGLLVARKGKINEHHFGHHSSKPCRTAVETAVHRLAKQILEERRELLLPAVDARDRGHHFILRKAASYRFDTAVLEQPLEGVVPDVIVTKGNHRLLVEIVVTHRCEPEKVERIERMGVSAVEIDLSGLPRDANAAEIERALCEEAPRWWVANPKLGEAAAELKAQLDREEAELKAKRERAAERERVRQSALVTGTWRAFARPIAQRPRHSGHRRVVEAAGYGRFIGLTVEGDDCLEVERYHWQAALLKVAVIDQAARPTASWEGLHTTDILKEVPLRPRLRPGVRDFYSSADEAAVRAVVPGFQAPFKVVEAYLGYLAASGLLHRSQKRWCVTRQAQHDVSEHQRLERAIAERRQSILQSVKRILAMLPPEEVQGFMLASWLNSVVGEDGKLVGELLEGGAEDVWALGGRLAPLEAMVLNDGKPAEDLLGLPLEGVRERQRVKHDAKAEEERHKREAAARREVERRVAALKASARSALGVDAEAWLGRAHAALGGRPPLEAAAVSDADYWSADAQLRVEEANLRGVRATEALRDGLKEAARKSAQPDRALLFLTSANPLWENRRPIEHCVDDSSFQRILVAMAAAARR
jgi:hypothetical protein